MIRVCERMSYEECKKESQISKKDLDLCNWYIKRQGYYVKFVTNAYVANIWYITFSLIRWMTKRFYY